MTEYFCWCDLSTIHWQACEYGEFLSSDKQTGILLMFYIVIC
jgi:hypothetical protein